MEDGNKESNNKISFVRTNDYDEKKKVTYHILSNKFRLKAISTKTSYIDFNSSFCFINGTDMQSMKNSKSNWQCSCLPGWHGRDCGQPEVLWRAILAHKRPIRIQGPRIIQRKIIYIFKVDKYSEHVADIRLNELGNIVDLFILYENRNSDFLEKKLAQKFAYNFHNKILYLKCDIETVWKTVKSQLKNLNNEDILLTSNSNEIPNRNALIFLKFYNGWPQPIKLRLRFSVYGFFWMHPSQTIITSAACTVSYLKDNFSNNLKLLLHNKTLSSPSFKGIILGDLNHYGGWYCEHCRDPEQTVEYLSNKSNDTVNWDNYQTKKIDRNFIEDLIENGVYIDGKTELKRTHRYHDTYFAPSTVTENNWKYDFLLINFYSKIDYYEG